jgi:ATP-binding cassette subfamily B protein
VLLALLLGVKGTIGYLKMLFITRQGKDFTYRLVEKLYNNLMYLPKTFFDLRNAGELSARMNDTTRIQSKVSLLFGNMMDDIVLAVTFALASFLYSPALTLIISMSVPLYIFLTYLFNDNVIRSQRKLIGSAVTLESLFIETAESMDTIKSLNRESFFETLYKQTFGFFQTKIFHIGKLNARFTFFAELMNAAFIVVAFIFCSWSWKNENLQGGEAIALFAMVTTVLLSVNRVAMANTQLQEVRIAFNRIYDFMIIKPENFNDPVPGVHDRISFEDDFRFKIKNLSFRFTGRRQLLRSN